jgi:hypothetical protein
MSSKLPKSLIILSSAAFIQSASAYTVAETEIYETPSYSGSAAAPPPPRKFKLTEFTMGLADYLNWHGFGNESSGSIPGKVAPYGHWRFNHLDNPSSPPPTGCFVYGPYVPMPAAGYISGEFAFYNLSA